VTAFKPDAASGLRTRSEDGPPNGLSDRRHFVRSRQGVERVHHFPAADLGALLIDMNGKEVQLWKGLQGFPNKLLPNGQVFGSTGLRAPDHSFQDQTDLVQVDWEGNIVWRFSRLEHTADPWTRSALVCAPASRLSARR
jgi:hypothetical protein